MLRLRSLRSVQACSTPIRTLFERLSVRPSAKLVTWHPRTATSRARAMEASEGSGSKADAVLARLESILQEVDTGITTQRQIINKLAEELGDEVYDYKALIREQITKFLDSQPGKESVGDPSADSRDNVSEDVPEETAGTKRKRSAIEDQNDNVKVAKSSQGNDEFLLELSSTRQVRVSKFKGTVYVSIREYYDKDGTLNPGKGVSLQVPYWKTLAANVDDIATAVSDEDTGYVCSLSQKHQASVKVFRGKVQVDLREFYEKDGELLPGKKGIALDLAQWEKLVEAVPDINAAVQQQAGAENSHHKAEPAKQPRPVKEHATDAAGASAATAEEEAELSGQVADLPIQLSAMRKADVSAFHGMMYVNIREYYEKDGKQMPGKKGISLPADQFQKLLEAESAVTEALAASNTDFELQLSGKRKASISEFRGKLMVNIREYYEKDGKDLPGKKGISLPPEQWHKLVSGLGPLDAALKEQTD